MSKKIGYLDAYESARNLMIYARQEKDTELFRTAKVSYNHLISRIKDSEGGLKEFREDLQARRAKRAFVSVYEDGRMIG